MFELIDDVLEDSRAVLSTTTEYSWTYILGYLAAFCLSEIIPLVRPVDSVFDICGLFVLVLVLVLCSVEIQELQCRYLPPLIWPLKKKTCE
jgi:hypothetical protein